jgi:multidrug efflux pump subunit AcrA (membrane-fusion protein)
MKTKISAWLVGAALALTGFTIKPAMADEWNKETRLQISEPLEIPGQVLAPGTYIFKLADSSSDRQIVQVFSEDGNGNQKFVTTIFAIAAYTVNTPDKPIITL